MSELTGKTSRQHAFDGFDIDELFALVRRSEEGALEEFCARVRPGLVQIASYRVGNISREDAEDLAHESLLIFVEKREDIETSPTAFLRSILYNLIGNYLRRRSNDKTLNGDGLYEAPNLPAQADRKAVHETRIENHDLLERAERAITAMAEPCRTMLIGLIEGQDVKDLWEQSRRLEPDLKRSAFDRRLYVCRRKLWGLLGIDL